MKKTNRIFNYCIINRRYTMFSCCRWCNWWWI